MQTQTSKRVIAANFWLLVLMQLLVSTKAIDIPENFNCATDLPEFPLNIEKISGTWYEVARVPEVEVPACVSVVAPTALTGDKNNTYALTTNFINNSNRQWLNTTETLAFPWTEEASKGQFKLVFGNNIIAFTYKIVYTDYTNMAVVCGYSSFSSSIPSLKVLSRERQVSKSFEDSITALVNKYGQGYSVGWVEQSERCNGARKMTSLYGVITAILFMLLKM